MPSLSSSRAFRVLRVVFVLATVLAVVVAALWVFGPRDPVRLDTSFDAGAIEPDLDRYLARTEANIPNLRPDAAKNIIWAYPTSRAKTPIALVYVHGFSASRDEIRPLPDEVARRLGSNLFFTRLAGHGRNGDAMAEPTVGDWIDDFAEAMAIGRRLGERVVVIATSTGATLATLGASRHELAADLAGLVEISPNFGLANSQRWKLTLPFARQVLPYLGPENYGADEAQMSTTGIWTQRYPTRALLPMARLVEATQGIDPATLSVPALFIYSPGDRVVLPERTRDVAARWGGPHQTILVEDSTDPSQHVIAGDAVSPNTTERLAAAVADWIATLPAATP